MKKLFNRTLFVLCAVFLLISVVSVWAAAEEAATPTDLIPQEGEIIPEEPGKEPEPEGDGITSVEVVITKTLTVGQSWEGKMKKTKPAVLKLDVTKPGLVYMLVEGKDVWATVEKSDRQTENPTRTKTDPETDRMVISWEAEEGSYLITLGPVEPNLLAAAKVTFMDRQAYDAWEKEQAEKEPEEEPEEESEVVAGEELEEEPANEPEEELKTELEEEPEEKPIPEQPAEETEPETEEDLVTETEEIAEEEQAVDQPEEASEEFILPEDRNAVIEITWDDDEPDYGAVAHFDAELFGYDKLRYTLQWQWSADDEIWTDVTGATDTHMDVIYTQENGSYYWRLMVYIEMPDRK